MKAISELIHQLQQERGLSVLFISGGMEMEALKEQRKNTNKTIPGFQYHLIASTLPDELKKEGTAMANTLQRVRGKTDGSASEGEIKHAYTGLIRTSMELQGAVSRAKTAKGFGRRFVSLMILEEAKERAGLFQAIMSTTLANGGGITGEQLNELTGLKSVMDSNLSFPGLAISKLAATFLQMRKESSIWKDVNGVYSEIMSLAGTGGYSDNGETFFGTLTRIIGDIEKTITMEHWEIESKAAQLSNAAAWRLKLSIAFFLASVLVAVVFVFFTGRSIVKSTRARQDHPFAATSF